MSQPLTLAQAAELMGVSRSHARRILTRRHHQNPALGILQRPTGAPEGHIVVNPRALRALLVSGTASDLDDMSQRVGLLESDIASLQVRMARVEKKNVLQPKRSSILQF